MSEIGRVNKHKTTHQDGGADEIDTTGLTRSPVFVSRGDPSLADFTLTTLITDGAWHDLDLSSIVPDNAIAVSLYTYLLDNAVASYIMFRKKGNTGTKNISMVTGPVASVDFEQDIIVFLDANGVIEYLASNVTFTEINITVKGWWI